MSQEKILSPDTAFHLVAQARLDPEFAKKQIILLFCEWYMHPNGQIPACEYNLSMSIRRCWPGRPGASIRSRAAAAGRDRNFLAPCSTSTCSTSIGGSTARTCKGKLHFCRRLPGPRQHRRLRSLAPLPDGFSSTGRRHRLDGHVLHHHAGHGLELAHEDPAYEDIASRFFEHFVDIADALNTLGGSGLWDEQDGFYYDHLRAEGMTIPLRLRSLVGFVPLLAVEVIDDALLEQLPTSPSGWSGFSPIAPT